MKFLNIAPRKALKIIDSSMLPVFLIYLALQAIALYYALWNSPVDYQQGNAVRIMYVHVPSAWLSLMIYTAIAVLSVCTFIWNNPLFNFASISLAPIGCCFAFITLVTGSIWGKPIWGTWWVWDARLTSMLVLFLLYIGYISLYNAYDNNLLGSKMAAILAIFGFINIPIIKFSVEVWNSLHQPASIMRKGGIAIDPAMLKPLMLMFSAFILLSYVIFCLRLKRYLLEMKLRRRA